jgi:hypothetical protein
MHQHDLLELDAQLLNHYCLKKLTQSTQSNLEIEQFILSITKSDFDILKKSSQNTINIEKCKNFQNFLRFLKKDPYNSAK